jgi:hypothetical protein
VSLPPPSAPDRVRSRRHSLCTLRKLHKSNAVFVATSCVLQVIVLLNNANICVDISIVTKL